MYKLSENWIYNSITPDIAAADDDLNIFYFQIHSYHIIIKLTNAAS